MEPQQSHWEHFEHKADMGVRGIAPTLAGAFEQAALALTAITTDPGLVQGKEAIRIQTDAPDMELLFADWLNALITEASTRRMVFGRFQVQIEGNHLSACAWGERVDSVRHQPTVEVKGATYTCLKVAQDAHGFWAAQCVVDV